MSIVAWQGWRLEIPSRWNPVRLEGDWFSGHALFADLHRPRLGLRWRLVRNRKGRDPDVEAVLRKSLRDEVGALAASEAQPFTSFHEHAGNWPDALLYLEPEPPGRDVFVGYSRQSGRLVQLIHHAHRREHILQQVVLPTLTDRPGDQPMPWSIFELSCTLPPGWKMQGQQLNAGDLSITFGRQRHWLTVRQMAVAQLALQRMPLEKWLARQERQHLKLYRPAGEPEALRITASDRRLDGVSRAAVRRRRFFFLRWVPERLRTWALHDAARDRLVLLQGTDADALNTVAPTIGWARETRGQEQG